MPQNKHKKEKPVFLYLQWILTIWNLWSGQLLLSQLDQSCLSRRGKRDTPYVSLPIVSGKPTHLSGIKLLTLGKPHLLVQGISGNLFSSKFKSQLTRYFDKHVWIWTCKSQLIFLCMWGPCTSPLKSRERKLRHNRERTRNCVRTKMRSAVSVGTRLDRI